MNENRIPRHVRSQERITKEKYLTIPRIYVAAARNAIGNNCTLQTSADVCAWFAVYGSERVRNEGDRRSSNHRVLAADGRAIRPADMSGLPSVAGFHERSPTGQLTVIMKHFLRVNRASSILNQAPRAVRFAVIISRAREIANVRPMTSFSAIRRWLSIIWMMDDISFTFRRKLLLS